MWEVFLITSYLLFLAISSYEDMKTHTVKLGFVIPLFLLSLPLLALWERSLWLSLIILLTIIMMFALPCLFSFGFGDFLVLISMWPFFRTVEQYYTFLMIFLPLWAGVTVVVLLKAMKKVKDMELKARIRYIFFREEIPLLPIVLVAFLLWFVFTFAQLP